MNLGTFFRQNNRLAIAFSGGVDSAYLLYAAVHAGCDVRAYYARTQFQPAFELEDARRLAKQIGVEMQELEIDVLSVAHVRENPADRCYFCKRALFTEIIKAAARDGFSLLADGTNASDDADDRPGMCALKELRVCSPLRVCGLTKAEIRILSKEAGLFTWDKPAYACLATRIPTGATIDEDVLKRVERAEDAMREMGFRDLRVRVLSDAARLQLTETDFLRAVSMRKEILSTLQNDFPVILLDMKTR